MADDDIYKAPSFQFYPDDFTADTADLTAEEVGVYMRLMCHEWKQGGIPRDVTRQSLIGRVTPSRMRAIAKTLAQKFESHASDASLLVQPRLERVREDARQHSEEQSARGKRGAEKRWHKDSVGIAQAMPKHSVGMPQAMLTDSTPISDLQDQLASLADSAPAHVPSPDDRSGKSPAYEFCFWMLREGIKAGAIREHHGIDPAKWAYPYLDAAEVLLSAPDMGIDAARERTARMFAMKVRGDLRREVSPKTLLDAWDWDEFKGTFALQKRDSAKQLSPEGQDFIARLRAETERQ